jgi:hypothetical protein
VEQALISKLKWEDCITIATEKDARFHHEIEVTTTMYSWYFNPFDAYSIYDALSITVVSGILYKSIKCHKFDLFILDLEDT